MPKYWSRIQIRKDYSGLYQAKSSRLDRIRLSLKPVFADPNPESSDPYVFKSLGSGSISQRHGSGSFYHQAKVVFKTLIPTVL
jgi:hypothetical protein